MKRIEETIETRKINAMHSNWPTDLTAWFLSYLGELESVIKTDYQSMLEEKIKLIVEEIINDDQKDTWDYLTSTERIIRKHLLG